MASESKLGRFLLISAVLHVLAAILTLNIRVLPKLELFEPIQILFLDDEPSAKNEDLPQGRITDAPPPAKPQEKPAKAEAVASFDAKAGAPQNKIHGRGVSANFGPGAASLEKQDTPVLKEADVPPAEEPLESARPPLSGDEIDKFALANPGGVMETENEIVIPLNTRKSEYVKYFLAIKSSLERAWTYPEEAMKSGKGGKTVLRFTVAKNGELETAKLLGSSGVNLLDSASMDAIKMSAPFPPFPAGLEKERVHIVATFDHSPQFVPARQK